jgi:hypothetical protein
MVPSTLAARGTLMKRLKTEDRHAVDLLLERPDGSGAPGLVEMVFARPVKGKFEDRLEAAERVLNLLDHLPVEEPPANLISRTMQRIEQAQLEPRAAHAPRQRAPRTTQKHA